MNYLKKKLKSHKRGHEDPEDFDDYIPVAPPHPSEVLRLEQEAARLAKATPEELAAIEDKKKKEEERLAAKEEAKKDSEGWKFFEGLTARVNDTVTKTQAVADKFKDSTTAEELTRQADIELGFLDPVGPDEEEERGASFAKGQWIGFGESASGQDDDNWGEKAVQTRKASVIVAIQEESSDPTFCQNLLDDFGFGPPTSSSDNNLAAPQVPVLYDSCNEEIEDDPFDTSYVNVSLVAKKAAEEAILESKRINDELQTQQANIEQFVPALPPKFDIPLPDLSFEEEEPEPEPEPEPDQDVECETQFTQLSTSRRASEVILSSSLVNPSNMDLDASPVEPDPIGDVDDEDEELNDPAIASIYKHGQKVLSKFGSNTSLASILSNPFLNEGDTDLYASGMCTPYSGAATPTRRQSTNPFADSPQEEDVGFSANAIAALTQDFNLAMADPDDELEVSKSKPPPPRPDAPKAAPPKPKPPTLPPPPAIPAPPPSPQPPELPPLPATVPCQPVALVSDAPSVVPCQPVPVIERDCEQPFDPFATIRDDHSDHSGSNRPSLSTDPDVQVPVQVQGSAASGQQQSQLDMPPIPDYPSDVSDNDEDAETFADQNKDQVPGTDDRRRSSAFPSQLLRTESESETQRQVPAKETEIEAVAATTGYSSRQASVSSKVGYSSRQASVSAAVGYSSRQASVVVEQEQEAAVESNSRRSSKISIPDKPYFDQFARVDEHDPQSPTTPEAELTLPPPPEAEQVEHESEYLPEPDVELEPEPEYEPQPEQPEYQPEPVPEIEHEPDRDPEPAYEQPKPNYDYHEEVEVEEEEQEQEAAVESTGIENIAFEDSVQLDETQEFEVSRLDLELEVTTATEAVPIDDYATDGYTVTTTSDTIAVIEASDTAGMEAATGGSDSGVGGIGFDDTDPGRDPFDTSDFSFEPVQDSVPYTDSTAFDAFSSRFEQTTNDQLAAPTTAKFDPFSSPAHKANPSATAAAAAGDSGEGFDVFDPFSTAHIRPPKNTPVKVARELSKDSFDDEDEAESFKVVIKAKMREPLSRSGLSIAPLLPPPPKAASKSRDFDTYESRPDDFSSMLAAKRVAMAEPVKSVEQEEWQPPALGDSATATKRSDSVESPSTPLYDMDMSLPLEPFPAPYTGDGWEMYIRHPAKKKLTANRFWKKIFVRVSENSVVQLFNKKEDNDPFQELPLQPSYSLSEISAQQYDQYGKIFTLKLQYIFYRERVGVRKAQIAKVIQGQIQSVGQIAKLGMPLEHAPQVSELLKLGTLNYEELKVFAQVVEEALFRQPLHRDRALTYKTEEIQIIMQDELYVEQSKTGTIEKQLARVRLFFTAFINGMPEVEIGVNDMTRQGKEVVGRYDILPVITEEWIRIENYEFHSSVMLEEFERCRILKLIPPDACFFELMRFRVRPPKNRELPLQVATNLTITKTKVELKCEVLVPGCISRKHGQIACEDIAIRLHIPECWIYFFRTEKHLRYGSAKSANRRYGKIKVRFAIHFHDE